MLSKQKSTSSNNNSRVHVYEWVVNVEYVDFQSKMLFFFSWLALVFVFVFVFWVFFILCSTPSLPSLSVPWGNDKCYTLYNVPRLLTRSIRAYGKKHRTYAYQTVYGTRRYTSAFCCIFLQRSFPIFLLVVYIYWKLACWLYSSKALCFLRKDHL